MKCAKKQLLKTVDKLAFFTYLFQVVLEEIVTGQRYTFPCGQWLATDEGNGQIFKDLYPVRSGGGVGRSKVGGLQRASSRRSEYR